jgi:2-(1,2-epoxy-1,2-dihydrophenyl)acetyl-CoA isomerase
VAAPDDTQPVLFTEVAGRVGTITLNRPARRNALNGELIGALDAAVRQMADDPEVKVVVLTGAAPAGGTGGFCSGGDVKDGASGPGGEKGVPVDALSGDLSRHDHHAAMLLHMMPKPTIAMVGGPAVGAGCSLAAACDLRFASEDAVFSVSFSPNGLSGD